MSLIPELASRLPEAQAAPIVWDSYHVVGPLAMAGVLSLAIGMVTLGTHTMRRGNLPKLAGIALLAGVPGAILLQLLALAADGVRIPHAPVAVALSLAVYGLAMRNFTELPTSRVAPEPAAEPAHPPLLWRSRSARRQVDGRCADMRRDLLFENTCKAASIRPNAHH